MRSLPILLIAGALAGCASKAENVSAAYVSPIQYSSYSCSQLRQEAARLSSRAAQLAGVQDDKATGDAIKTGVALVVFWPAAFFIKGDGATAPELARLKGEMEAVEAASIHKNCGITFRRA